LGAALDCAGKAIAGAAVATAVFDSQRASDNSDFILKFAHKFSPVFFNIEEPLPALFVCAGIDRYPDSADHEACETNRRFREGRVCDRLTPLSWQWQRPRGNPNTSNIVLTFIIVVGIDIVYKYGYNSYLLFVE
jgi:hypothetical protein